MQALQRPPSLSPGSRVRIVAPSSPFDRERFEKGLPLLQARYDVQLADGLFDRRGFLAGDDDARLRALIDALEDPTVEAIIAARGGCGVTRLLPRLDVELVRRANKWLVGFSDVTALHALWARAGLCSIHGPMVCSLWEASQETQDEWFGLLEGRDARPLPGLTTVHAGTLEGVLMGGNLTVLAALVGTPYMPSLDGAVLLLEDVTERPYRLDRMLTTMLQAGALDGVRGVLLGQFTQCDPGPDGVTALDVLGERLGTLGVPVLAGAPVGHVGENWPVVLGGRTTYAC